MKKHREEINRKKREQKILLFCECAANFEPKNVNFKTRYRIRYGKRSNIGSRCRSHCFFSLLINKAFFIS
jgi:hypothetical protein